VILCRHAGVRSGLSIAESDSQEIFVLTTSSHSAREDLSAAIDNCTGCQFQSAADLIGGHTTEVQLSTASTPVAAVLTLKRGALNGTVTWVGNNQFLLNSDEGSPWPANILVLNSSVTEFLGSSTSSATIKVGQAVSARGLLFKSGPTGVPTRVVRRVFSRAQRIMSPIPPGRGDKSNSPLPE
jgi:hypothetical protein